MAFTDRKISQLPSIGEITGAEYILVVANGLTYKTTIEQMALDIGEIEIDKESIGLGNVDNTSDLDKPISNATQEALNLKLNIVDLGDAVNQAVESADLVSQSELSSGLAGKANTAHTHVMADITDLSDALDLKADASAIPGLVETALQGIDIVTEAQLNSGLSGKADTVHEHEMADVTGLVGALGDKADTSAIPGLVESALEGLDVVTSTQLSSGLSTKADIVHSHVIDDVTGLTSALNDKADTSAIPGLVETALQGIDVVTSEQLSTGLSGKANTVHDHEIADVTGLSAALGNKADTSAIPGLVESALEGLDVVTESQLNSGLSGKADTVHGHAIADVTGLTSALEDKVETSAIDGLISTALGEADVITSGELSSGLSGKADTVHSHAMGDVTGLTDALDLKANTADIPSLVNSALEGADVITASQLSSGLAGKADTVHTHAIADVTGLRSELDDLDLPNGATGDHIKDENGWKRFNRYDLLSQVATDTLDVSTSNVFEVDASVARNITITNPPASTRSMVVLVRFTGNANITWATPITWDKSTAPEFGDNFTDIALIWVGGAWSGKKSLEG